VPPILVVMSFHPAFEKFDMSTLRVVLSGAAPLRDRLVKKVLARLADLGNNEIRLTQGYVPHPPSSRNQLDRFNDLSPLLTSQIRPH
jgi:acyl-CoA synthetase (AMP-forming)/AMP-acid ligase II